MKEVKQEVMDLLEDWYKDAKRCIIQSWVNWDNTTYYFVLHINNDIISLRIFSIGESYVLSVDSNYTIPKEAK